MATRTIANGGGNWNTVGTWVEGAVPTSADDVVATSTSGNLTIDGASACRSINLTNYGTHTLTHNVNSTLSIGDGTAGPGNVALYFPSTITYTKGGGGSSALAFVSTSATQQTIDLGGATNGSVTFDGAGGSWKLLSGLTGWTGVSAVLTLTAGSLDTNGQTITMGYFVGSGSSTRSLTLGTSNLSFGHTGFRVWDFRTTTNLTLSASSSTIELTGASPTFDGDGGSYGTLMLTGSGTSTLISGHTFVNLTRSNAAACSLVLPAGKTTTITGTFQASGTSGKVVTITSSSAGSAATLSKSSGVVSCDYLSLKDSTAGGGAGWYAGRNSTDVSGNSGWAFVDCISRSAALGSSATVAATGQKVTVTVVERAAAVGATAAIAVVGFEELARSAALAATATVATAGHAIIERSGALTATSAVSVSATEAIARSVTLTATSGIATDFDRGLIRGAALVATTSVSAAGEVSGIVERGASVTATAQIASAPQREIVRSVALASAASVAASSRRELHRSATLTATTQVTVVSGGAAVERLAAISSASSIVTAGGIIVGRSAALSAQADATVQAFGRELARRVQIGATGALSVAGEATVGRASALDAVSAVAVQSFARDLLRSAGIDATTTIAASAVNAGPETPAALTITTSATGTALTSSAVGVGVATDAVEIELTTTSH